jgi:Protein of unknown function (DUF2800)
MNDEQSRGQWTSASSAEADAKCPGRFQASRNLPEPPPSDDAQSGTRIHAALAGKLPSAELTPDEHELYLDCIRIEERLAGEYFADVDEVTITREKRYWLRWAGLEHSGQADVVRHGDDKIAIFDYKTGRNEVAESSRNLQLRDLAVLVANHQESPPSEVMVVVIQPTSTHQPERCIYNGDDLLIAEHELKVRVAASHHPKAKRVPGETQCRYCKAAYHGRCAEYNAWAGAMLPVPKNLVDLPFASWSPDQCAQYLDAKNTAHDWLERAELHCRLRLMADANAIPGYYLKDGNTKRTITDVQKVFERYVSMGGSQEKFIKAVGLGLGDLKELIHDLTDASGSALNKAVDAMIADAHEARQNAPSIVKSK